MSADQIELDYNSDNDSETSQSQAPLTMAAAMMQLGTLVEAIVLNRDKRHRKVYVSMPDKFDGKFGDYIDGWLEQFQTWFAHREKVEGPVDPRTRIETAIQNTRGDISLLLSKHEADPAKFPTWDSFANFMKASYGSKESGFVRYTRLRLLTQGAGETVDAFYARFYKLCSRQKRWMRTPDDNFIYNYMFIEGLRKEVQQELLCSRFPCARVLPKLSALGRQTKLSGWRVLQFSLRRLLSRWFMVSMTFKKNGNSRVCMKR